MASESPLVALFYSHLHDRIRDELDSISTHVRHIDAQGASLSELKAIRNKLKFLNQVYSYHSVAEDEVVYPALDSKVKNVTLAYRVEHAEEGHLLGQLMQLLSSFSSDPKSIRALGCKVEEVSTTVRKHLAKEEEQLFPLLLRHFSVTEQASMIAQFLCCVPMVSVRDFLEWIHPEANQEERSQLVRLMKIAISDDILLKLIVAWIDPEAPDGSWHEAGNRSVASNIHRAPLRQIANVHRSIDRSMNGFIQEAKQLLIQDFDGDSLTSLLDQHRFIKDVCRFHRMSEEEVMFPEFVKRGPFELRDYEICVKEHLNEGVQFDKLGRLLMDARAAARRKRQEAKKMMELVIDCAEDMRENLGMHMSREEKEVFPVLEGLTAEEQCKMLWRTVTTMPLRLLEQVMPWMTSQLTESEYVGWMTALRIGGTDYPAPIALLSRWSHPSYQASHSPMISHEPTQKPSSSPTSSVPSKRRRTTRLHSGNEKLPNPVDHIFQFHRALQRDFRLFETEINDFAHRTTSMDGNEDRRDVHRLKGRFTFIWGLYQAHSKTEDEVIFPMLESKEATQNISHSYVLDHKQERALFDSIRQMLNDLIDCPASSMAEISLRLGRKCAAVRSELDTHIRAEESELWPLLVEHFDADEQQRMVGLIIGRTGAEVLQTIIPWVSKSFTEEETVAMMDSIKAAAKKTRFDKWMQNWNEPKNQVADRTNADRSMEDAAAYLRRIGLIGESTEFSPSLEDMFRLNQIQLESAVRTVSSDASLEPQRKSYLIQRILASNYIIKQQTDGKKVWMGPSYACKEKGVLGCVHYERNCALVAPCCGGIYVCRLCHDAEEDHKLNRYEVTEIVCMNCSRRQPVSNTCIECGIAMAEYFCSICRLYDNRPEKKIYHCPFCNVCRRGEGLGHEGLFSGQDFWDVMKPLNEVGVRWFSCNRHAQCVFGQGGSLHGMCFLDDHE